MLRVIRTASGVVTLGQYAAAWRTVKASPGGTEFKSSLCGRSPETRETILRQFAEGLHDRINIRGGLIRTGRNFTTDQYWRFWRDSRAIRRHFTERLRVYSFETRAAHARFSHLLASRDDF